MKQVHKQMLVYSFTENQESAQEIMPKLKDVASKRSLNKLMQICTAKTIGGGVSIVIYDVYIVEQLGVFKRSLHYLRKFITAGMTNLCMYPRLIIKEV